MTDRVRKKARKESDPKSKQMMSICTVIGGCGLIGFGDIATFDNRPNFPFRAWTIVHAHQKI